MTLAFETVFMTLHHLFMALGLSYSDFTNTPPCMWSFRRFASPCLFVISAKACKFRVSDIVTFKKHSPLLEIGVFCWLFGELRREISPPTCLFRRFRF